MTDLSSNLALYMRVGPEECDCVETNCTSCEKTKSGELRKVEYCNITEEQCQAQGKALCHHEQGGECCSCCDIGCTDKYGDQHEVSIALHKTHALHLCSC